MIGPGFSSGDSVAQLESLLNKPNAIDIVVTSEHIATADRYKDMKFQEIAAIYKKLYSFDFQESCFNELARLNAILTRAKIPRVLIALQSDWYNFQPQVIKGFDNAADMIVGMGPECWAYMAAMPNLNFETSWTFAKESTDYWAVYLGEYANKVSSIHHIIGNDEFCQTPLTQRKNKWSVLGVPYYARKAAIDKLKEAGLSPRTTNTVRKLLAGLKKIKILPGETNWSLGIVQKRFQKTLHNSCYSYTCGSGLDMPIRKFFEIPAAGAVLVCRPFRGAEKFGFKDGKNFIACEPEDIVEVHHWLEANPEQAQQIATAGQMMVKELHSVSARQEQIRQCLQAAINKSGVGRWNDRHFEIVTDERDRQLHFPPADGFDKQN